MIAPTVRDDVEVVREEIANPPSKARLEANRRNALRSTGPKTEEGKAKSRGNARTHGLTAQTQGGDEAKDEKLRDRIALWIEDAKPSSPHESWLIEVMAIESARYRECRDKEAELREREARRAETAWDADRHAEIETLAKKLALRPSLVQAELLRSKHGIQWLKSRWEGLAESLSDPGGWTEADRELALDLIGAPLELRRGRTCVDPFPQDELETKLSESSFADGESDPGNPTEPVDPTERDAFRRLAGLRTGDPTAYRRAFVAAMAAFLQERLDRLESVDEADRLAVVRRISPDFSRELKLLRRYENASFRRFQWACRRFHEIAETGFQPSPIVRSFEPPVPEETSDSNRSSDECGSENPLAEIEESEIRESTVPEATESFVEPIRAREESESVPKKAEKTVTTVVTGRAVVSAVGAPAGGSLFASAPVPVFVSRSPLGSLREALLGPVTLNRRQRRALERG